MAYLNDIRGFPDVWRSDPQLAVNHLPSSPLRIRCKTGRQIGARHPLATSWITLLAFFDARIAALTWCRYQTQPPCPSIPAWGFFWGLLPETSLSVLARFDESRLRFDLPVLLSVSRKSFLRALTGRVSGDVGAATLAAELAAAAGGADFIRTHEPRPLRDGLAVSIGGA
ncbi:dihydropteroate synthase [Acinetobacter indicus]